MRLKGPLKQELKLPKEQNRLSSNLIGQNLQIVKLVDYKKKSLKKLSR
jgi:hypothetical protein